ncbi:uncharacterized protein LOC110835657 isoform X2 [Zootermopsis nevadensis]|uniref:uncharacterized protein LOC110835657 isoform X2 n=1 Tax=Zootermopsis nevadensis TaxID=136037 RepID=UPI000B8E8EC6|nr:uncharacterized protein LOC110835657 isoform X2 [Zootermopsis nevadensis]
MLATVTTFLWFPAVYENFSVVAYVVAFTIELWWILEAEVTLPVPAYVLCAGYLFVFILSALLLHGLTVKRTLCLLGWLFMVGMFTFPEAGLVLFMTFHFWQVKSLNGLTELICWACRLVFNQDSSILSYNSACLIMQIAGLMCVQSLYSTWKEEKVVLRRLQALNMASILVESGNSASNVAGNGHPKNGIVQDAGYTNAAFVGSASNLGNITSVASRHKTTRSPVAHNRIRLGSHYPSNQQHFRVLNVPGMVSEFNTVTFNGMLAAGILKDIEPPQYRLSRSQSLGDLSNSDLWRMNSYTAVDYVPVNSTQSLDRRMLRYNTRLRRAGSMEELNNLRYCHNGSSSLWCEGRVYNVLQPHNFCPYGQPKFVNKSRTSLSESDDLQKYRDVAL